MPDIKSDCHHTAVNDSEMRDANNLTVFAYWFQTSTTSFTVVINVDILRDQEPRLGPDIKEQLGVVVCVTLPQILE